MRRLALAALLLGIVIVVGFAAVGVHRTWAQGRGGGGKWWEGDRARSALGLTDEQSVAIASLNEAHVQRLKEARPEITKAMRILITLLDDPDASPEEIADTRRELENLWLDFARGTMDHWQALRGELSAKQWQQLPNAAPGAIRLGMFALRVRQPRSQE
jgi:Spy/CpxP family protein refolding chaperone